MGTIQTLTEGGQIWAHRMRMFKQVMKISIYFSCFIWIAVFAYSMCQFPFIMYQAAWYNLEANYFVSASVDKMEVNADVWQKIAHEKRSSDAKVNPNRVLIYTKTYFDDLLVIGKAQLIKTSWITSVSFIGIILYFFIRGRISKRKKHISGKKITKAWKIKLLLKLSRKASSIKLGNLPLIKNSETQHILVTGGTGSGKTNCFHHILPQIRNQRQRAIIVDTTGTFVERYFRPGKDILLNPYDICGSSWHPWAECQDQLDIESMAEGFIPQSYSENDNYWRSAARSLLSSVLWKLRTSQQTSELTNQLLFESLSNLAAFVQGTKAAAHIDLNSEKTAGSIRSVATTFLG